MLRKPIDKINSQKHIDIESHVHDPESGRCCAVQIDLADVARLLDVPLVDLVNRMLAGLTTALAIDACELADQQMRAWGDRFVVDGYPAGWPVEQVTAIVRCRFFPEIEQ